MVIDRFFSLFSKDMAIDLGTANTLVYVKGEGVILNEPSVVATIENDGNTQVLATVVVGKAPGEHQDFFPLTVNYQEKTYATGKIPGGFFKREGRPSEKETLTSRLIDRPLRPLFNDDFLYEVQVICTVVSSDKDVDPDILSFIAASAAIGISGLPFNGPLGAVRVGFIEGQYCLNPKRSELEDSLLDMVIASVLMSMGMMMLPPVIISMPFKIMLFVIVDGWNLIVRGLMVSVQ